MLFTSKMFRIQNNQENDSLRRFSFQIIFQNQDHYFQETKSNSPRFALNRFPWPWPVKRTRPSWNLYSSVTWSFIPFAWRDWRLASFQELASQVPHLQWRWKGYLLWPMSRAFPWIVVFNPFFRARLGWNNFAALRNDAVSWNLKYFLRNEFLSFNINPCW